jgi:hypothetical protein
LVLSQKRQFFRWIFRRKYFKNHNIGSRWGEFSLDGRLFSYTWQGFFKCHN